jgi:hypothetical protein
VIGVAADDDDDTGEARGRINGDIPFGGLDDVKRGDGTDGAVSVDILR